MLKYIYVLYSIYIFICKLHINFKVFLVAHMVKNLPAVQETWVWSLGQEDPLEKRMATRYSMEKRMATRYSILAWRIPWTEEPGRLQSMGSQRAGHDWATNTYFYLLIVTFIFIEISFIMKNLYVLHIFVQSIFLWSKSFLWSTSIKKE